MTERPSRLALVGAFAAIYLIWGSTYLAIRFGVADIPPFFLAGVRFVLPGLAFLSWALSRGAVLPTRRQVGTTVLIGMAMATGGNGLMSWSLQTVPSGLGALIIGLVPLWVVLFDWGRPGGTRPGGRVMLGVVLGFGGVALLIDPTQMSGARQIDPVGAWVIVVASLSWASGSVFARYADQPSSQALSAGMQMLGGGLTLLILSALTGEWARLDLGAAPPRAYLAWGYATVFGSVAYLSYVWLLKASTPAKAATYAYVNPVIALVLGALIGDEVLTLWTLGCSAVVVAAVLLVVSR